MKQSFFILLLFLAISCSPRINYLGDTAPPTTQVDTYFDMGDITKEYKVLGLLSANNADNGFLSLNDLKEKLIEEAKKRGADAILFLNLASTNNDGLNDTHFIEAKLLKYR